MDFLGTQISNAIWDAMLKWFYEIIYGAIADFFEMMGNMGADVFDLEWVKATVKLFTLFGWGLFVAGTVVAVFDVAIEYQCGRANVKTTALNIIKGFFACSLIGVVPIELYKFCISLQNTFSHDLARIFAGTQSLDLAGQSTSVLQGSFMVAATAEYKLFNLLAMIAFAYCIIKIFFQNIKRGGILLVQMAVGALYMFSVPRGYADGFNQWCKQVVAICLTAFMQTTLLFLGLLTFPQNMLLGLGIMLAANEVPRIAQQFGLDSSVRVNMMSVVHATTTAVNLSRSVNSYEVQRTHYEERIRTEPKWSLVGIFADKGITGTSMKKRDEFNKMLRLCYRDKIDMIIVKSISRFARNTLDVIKITRKLREINVDVYFEEQGIHSIDPASEFYITIYGSIAQSESENISANVKWGKAQSAKQGNVPFQCKHFLGYTKNADGEIEIVPEEAEIIREIYERYLSGESLHGIKCYLEAKEIPTPAGCSVWRQETIRSILSNEKYKGDAIINKTYVSDCISKRIKANNGERNKYYIENNHPAIIDAGTFARVQEEIARRSGKPKVKQKGTKTELSRYSSKYALSELLICGECRTPYRRCTWTAKGKRKIVWRCINRLDYGKKYCHHSPSIEESLLQDAVMRAIMQTAKQNIEVLKTLKIHIGMGLTDEVTENKTLDIQIRIAEIDAEFQKMLKAVSADNADGIDEERITELMNEKQRLTVQLEQYATMRQKRESAKSRLDEIFTILDGLQNHPMEYDDTLVRQIIECVVVESKEKIKVVFIGGTEIEMTL